MPQIRFDVTGIISQIYGSNYVSRKYSDTEGAQLPEEFDPVVDGLNHNGTNGAYYMTPLALNGYQLPNEPLVSIACGKEMVKTKLAGNTRRGTVKEIINIADYDISIRGVIINENSPNYPFSEVEELKKIFEINEDISITNAITKMLGIERVVITNVSFPEMVGMPNMQAYQISCISDEDFVLIKE